MNGDFCSITYPQIDVDGIAAEITTLDLSSLTVVGPANLSNLLISDGSTNYINLIDANECDTSFADFRGNVEISRATIGVPPTIREYTLTSVDQQGKIGYIPTRRSLRFDSIFDVHQQDSNAHSTIPTHSLLNDDLITIRHCASGQSWRISPMLILSTSSILFSQEMISDIEDSTLPARSIEVFLKYLYGVTPKIDILANHDKKPYTNEKLKIISIDKENDSVLLIHTILLMMCVGVYDGPEVTFLIMLLFNSTLTNDNYYECVNLIESKRRDLESFVSYVPSCNEQNSLLLKLKSLIDVMMMEKNSVNVHRLSSAANWSGVSFGMEGTILELFGSFRLGLQIYAQYAFNKASIHCSNMTYEQIGNIVISQTLSISNANPLTPPNFTISVKGCLHRFHVHDWILFQNWKYFQFWMSSGLSECKDRHLVLPSDFPTRMLRHMLLSIYGVNTKRDCDYEEISRFYNDENAGQYRLPTYFLPNISTSSSCAPSNVDILMMMVNEEVVIANDGK